MKIYLAKIEPLKKDLNKIIPLLNADRRERVMKLSNEKVKLESIYGGLLIRYAYLNEMHELPWEELKLSRTENGKPFFENADSFHYSLSHSKEYCALAVDDLPIGCDIQIKRDMNKEKTIAKRFFTESESKLCDEQDLFYRMWSMKEACSKLTGDGIPLGLSRYIYTGEKNAYDSSTKDNINIHYYECMADYILAIASREKEVFPKNIEIVEVKDLY